MSQRTWFMTGLNSKNGLALGDPARITVGAIDGTGKNGINSNAIKVMARQGADIRGRPRPGKAILG